MYILQKEFCIVIYIIISKSTRLKVEYSVVITLSIVKKYSRDSKIQLVILQKPVKKERRL